MKTPSSFEWLADKGFGAIIGNPYQVDPDLQGALDIYLDEQAKKGLDAATGNVWALLNAFCHEDDNSPVAIRAKASNCRSRPTVSIRARSSVAGRYRPTTRPTRTGSTSTTSRAMSRC